MLMWWNTQEVSSEAWSKDLGRVINWIMNEFDKLIAIQKDYLPLKAHRVNYPQIVWIEAPHHINFPNNLGRKRFNTAMETVVQFHENTWVLKLKKVWDKHDSSLFLRSENRYTAAGYRSYWDAVDKTVRYADTILLKKPVKKQNASGDAKKKSSSTKKFKNNDKYHWYKHHGDAHNYSRRSRSKFSEF